jgi:hypothetical protein
MYFAPLAFRKVLETLEAAKGIAEGAEDISSWWEFQEGEQTENGNR